MHLRELFDLTGKVAVVTGGSRGLGLEIAHGLGEAGAAVMISARRAEWLDPAADELRAAGVTCRAELADVTKPDDAERLIARTVEAFGQVDILVNNAGLSWGAPAHEMPLDRWQMVMDSNATGTFLMSQAAGRRMIERGTGGRIINVASVAGLVGTPPTTMDAIGYSASKGAIIALTRDLAVKWAPHGILVNAIAPGFFPTRLTRGVLSEHEADIARAAPLGRIGRPGELKGVVVFLAAEASSYITGQVIAVDGGTTAV
jgi:NAD(P)-dependent dehydrogenase (short-subunit alcohol dehydrogenase family)